MTTTLVVLLPLLPGKQEAWRQFYQILQGSRCDEYAAWRERMGITQEEVWLLQAAQGDLVRIHLQAEQPQRMLAGLMLSHRAFDRWLQQQLLELHGLNLRQFASTSAQELIFVWQPVQFQNAASYEE